VTYTLTDLLQTTTFQGRPRHTTHNTNRTTKRLSDRGSNAKKTLIPNEKLQIR